MVALAKEERIRNACGLVFGGMSYEKAGAELGVSRTTIMNYVRTPEWRYEWEQLRQQSAKVRSQAYAQKLERALDLLERSGYGGLNSSVMALEKINALLNKIDIDQIDSDKQVAALGILMRSYMQLASGSYQFLDQSLGITNIINQLENRNLH
ncbi:MAG: hypothetical protein HC796_10165 [Synechococcaceae cyanobacterium RL_1_2]|nr:hypothetical protein [Synechococcaceae cyanobacterium RL_1_2]